MNTRKNWKVQFYLNFSIDAFCGLYKYKHIFTQKVHLTYRIFSITISWTSQGQQNCSDWKVFYYMDIWIYSNFISFTPFTWSRGFFAMLYSLHNTLKNKSGAKLWWMPYSFPGILCQRTWRLPKLLMPLDKPASRKLILVYIFIGGV